MKRFLYVFWIMSLVGCASIDRTDRIGRFQYEIGKTTRNMILESLGLPDTSIFDEEKGVHLLGYKGKADGSDLFIPIPIAATPMGDGMSMVTFMDIAPDQRDKVKDMDIVFIVDKDNILIDAKKLDKR